MTNCMILLYIWYKCSIFFLQKQTNFPGANTPQGAPNFLNCFPFPSRKMLQLQVTSLSPDLQMFQSTLECSSSISLALASNCVTCIYHLDLPQVASCVLSKSGPYNFLLCCYLPLLGHLCAVANVYLPLSLTRV